MRNGRYYDCARSKPRRQLSYRGSRLSLAHALGRAAGPNGQTCYVRSPLDRRLPLYYPGKAGKAGSDFGSARPICSIMLNFCSASNWQAKVRRLASAMTVIALFSTGASVLVIPEIRAAQAGESESNERGEDPSLTSRFEHDRLMHLECRVAAFVELTRPNLGHAQRPVIEPHSGHRLSNGLLAPMTC